MSLPREVALTANQVDATLSLVVPARANQGNAVRPWRWTMPQLPPQLLAVSRKPLSHWYRQVLGRWLTAMTREPGNLATSHGHVRTRRRGAPRRQKSRLVLPVWARGGYSRLRYMTVLSFAVGHHDYADLNYYWTSSAIPRLRPLVSSELIISMLALSSPTDFRCPFAPGRHHARRRPGRCTRSKAA